MKQQLTKNAIRESFVKLLGERSFDKITVKSIVEDCGLTRNTFYYYYVDTYDILDDILTRELAHYSEMAEDRKDIREIIAEFVRYTENNQKLVNHVLKSSKWDELRVYVFKALDRAIESGIEKSAAGRELPPENREIIRSVCRAAAGGLIEMWFQNGNVRGLSEKIVLVDTLFGDCLSRAVEKSVRK